MIPKFIEYGVFFVLFYFWFFFSFAFFFGVSLQGLIGLGSKIAVGFEL